MANTNKDFLQFNAYQIRDLIKRKLAEDSKFTDQLYAGSNLSILIDIISYMLQGLLYSLNTAAAESMFSDTQFYENINRLCNFIGYSPHGCCTAASEFVQTADITLAEGQKPVPIPRYSYINTGLTDSNGKTIYYSVDSDGVFGSYLLNGRPFKLYNGRWKLYKNALITSGTDWETFTLDLKSNFNSNAFIPHGFIDIYARSPDGEWYQFKPTDSQLFRRPKTYNLDSDEDTPPTLYSGELETLDNAESIGKRKTNIKDAVFNLKLNEDKNYVITFGDGITAAKPPANSVLYIVYLESNGPGAELEPGDVTDATIKLRNDLGLPNDLQERIIGEMSINPSSTLKISDYRFTNTTKSSSYLKEETVEEIRQNAPNWFKSAGRLVTKNDYENFFKYAPMLRNAASDVKCQNNWEYTGTFYRWLYDLGLKHRDENGKLAGDPRLYLNQSRLVKSRYPMSDAADCNNIYLWYRPQDGQQNTDFTSELEKIIYPIKDITHEPIPCQGIPVSFAVTAAPEDIVRENVKRYGQYDNTKITKGNSYIEVLIDDNAMYTNTAVAAMITEKIRTFFGSNKLGLGVSPDFSQLMAAIYSINGIMRVRTIYQDKTDTNNARIFDGLCFASYSTPKNGLLDICEDLEISPNSRTMEVFQYPVYNWNVKVGPPERYGSLKTQFKVIKRSSSSLDILSYY